jgi:coenzyme F420-reducing hydrogenase gamma subunit
MKPKVAFFDLACCEGCQLQVANLGEELLDLLGHIEVVEFREIMSEKWEGEYDLAIIEGSVTNEEAEEKVKEIRKRSKLVMAYGACAVNGGINGIKNKVSMEDNGRVVYGDRFKDYPSKPTQAVGDIIEVEYIVPGCPIYPPEFLKVLKSALAGLEYVIPDHAVCVECRFNENECMYEKGINCMGPITRAGCNSWCLNNGNRCYGCRGLLSNPNIHGARDVMKKYDLDPDVILKSIDMYNAAAGGKDE